MTPEEFRQAGHALIGWITDYRQRIPEQPVRAQVAPGEVRQSFPELAPTEASDFRTLLDQLESRVVPGITQVQHPLHFGWFPSNASLASVLGDIATRHDIWLHVDAAMAGSAMLLPGAALDSHTLAWVDKINQSGQAFLSPSILDGRWVVRVSIGVEATSRAHVEMLWRLMRDTAEATYVSASRQDGLA